jgi:hypothetical protein
MVKTTVMQQEYIEELTGLLNRLAELFEDFADVCEQRANQILKDLTKV